MRGEIEDHEPLRQVIARSNLNCHPREPGHKSPPNKFSPPAACCPDAHPSQIAPRVMPMAFLRNETSHERKEIIPGDENVCKFGAAARAKEA